MKREFELRKAFLNPVEPSLKDRDSLLGADTLPEARDDLQLLLPRPEAWNDLQLATALLVQLTFPWRAVNS